VKPKVTRERPEKLEQAATGRGAQKG